MIHLPKKEITEPVYEQESQDVPVTSENNIIQEVIDDMEKEPPKKSWWTKLKEGLKNLWNKSIFPDKIKAMKEEKEWKRQLQKDVREEIRVKRKDEIVKQMVDAEIVKMNKPKKPMMEKLAAGFSMSGQGLNTNKISSMMKVGGGSGGSMFSDEKMKRLLGVQRQPEQVRYRYVNKKTKTKGKGKGKGKRVRVQVQQSQKKGPLDYDEKIARMLR